MLIYMQTPNQKNNFHFSGCISSCRIMGRKVGGLFINSKRFSKLHKPCMKEMTMFMNCMATNHSDVQACAQQKEILNTCIESQVI
jgi:hypothetical protein